MVDTATKFKIIAVFEIIVASLLGAAIPFLYIKHLRRKELENANREALNSRPIFFVLKAMTCGVIIGVALLHLAPDAEENLSDEYGYPVTFLLMGVGILINLICGQVALYIISTTHEVSVNSVTQKLVKNSHEFSVENDHADQPHVVDEHSPCSHSHSSSAQVSRTDSRARVDSCELGAVVAVFAQANDPRALLKAYVLEGAIAVHSIIMGISLGSMQNDELSNIKILMIAYAVHQFLEGISLGCAMSSTSLSHKKIAGLVFFFACTLPLGIVIGIIITYSIDDSHGQELVEGFANALASGILVYVSMVEMLAEEFGHPVVKGDFLLKAKMIMAMISGLTSMCVLAIWA